MTKADLENRLDELDTKEFLINMADRFTIKDRETLNAIDIERKRIFEILKKVLTSDKIPVILKSEKERRYKQ